MNDCYEGGEYPLVITFSIYLDFLNEFCRFTQITQELTIFYTYSIHYKFYKLIQKLNVFCSWFFFIHFKIHFKLNTH